MDPFFARNRLSAYLDGALTERESAEIAEALAADPSLRGEYEAMKTAVDLLVMLWNSLGSAIEIQLAATRAQAAHETPLAATGAESEKNPLVAESESMIS